MRRDLRTKKCNCLVDFLRIASTLDAHISCGPTNHFIPTLAHPRRCPWCGSLERECSISTPTNYAHGFPEMLTFPPHIYTHHEFWIVTNELFSLTMTRKKSSQGAPRDPNNPKTPTSNSGAEASGPRRSLKRKSSQTLDCESSCCCAPI